MSRCSPWLAHAKPRAAARLRLFCLPYAGAGALMYRRWADWLPSFIELWPVQLPGRETRAHETPFVSMDLLVDAMSTALSPYFDKPFAVFGHSMGAVIAFELAHKLHSERRPEPLHLFLSGRAAPRAPERGKATFDLPEKEFIEELKRLDGTPPEVLEDRELLAFLLPLLRADFELIQRYRYVTRPRLTCPITVFGGLADEDVSEVDLVAWRVESSGPFQMLTYPGGHFFLHHQDRLVIEAIVDRLSAYNLY